MLSPQRWWQVAGALVILCTAAYAQQKASISGIVHEVGGSPVSHVEVRVEGAGATLTSDAGEFALPMAASLRVGMAAVFHVKNWVILKPCELKNGRTYLRDPSAEPIEFFVLRPGDRGLRSGKYSMIGCVIVELASQFARAPKRTSAPRGSLRNGTSPQFQPAYFVPSAKPRRNSDSFLVEASYRPAAEDWASAPSPESDDLGRDGFLADKAKELGCSVNELESAIDAWSRSAQDSYDKGLAALYYGRYEEASTYITAAIASSKDDVPERYVPLARAAFERAKYADAEFALRKVLAAHGDDPVLLNLLALALDAQAKYTEAGPLYERALMIEENTFGPKDPSVAALLSNLADHKVKIGKYAEAEPLYKRALQIDEEAPEADDVSIATVQNNLARLYEKQGKYQQAERLFKQALATDERTLGPDHSSVATMLDNLAALYQNEGKYSVAEPLYKRALAIYEKSLGPDHPSEAPVLNNLARLYQIQGKYAEAESLYRRALAINEKTFGATHPSEATGLSNLGALYQAQNRYSEAETLYKQALEIYEKTSGPDHPEEVTLLTNLALLYHTVGRGDEAEPLLNRALKITQKTFGPDDPKVAALFATLANFYNEQRNYSQAELLFERALAIDEKASGPDHPNVARDDKGLALSCRAQGKLTDAELLYKRALTIDEQTVGPESREVTTDLDALASFYSQQERYTEAEPLYRRVLAIAEKWGPDLPAVADAAEDLADTLRQLDRDSEADAYLEQAAKIRAKIKPPPQP